MKQGRVCIIDNEVGSAYRIWKGLKTFLSKKIDQEIDFKFIWVQFNELKNKDETEVYFRPKFTVDWYECKTEEAVQEEVDKMVGKYTFLLDLCLGDDEDGEPQIYRSMRIYRQLCDKGRKCHIYSRHIETDVVSRWENQYVELYKEESPEIIEREIFLENYFEEDTVKAILEEK